MMGLPQNGGKVFAMRHQKRVARLGRPADQRKALVRSLTTEVLRHGRITTTKVPTLIILRSHTCSVSCIQPVCSLLRAIRLSELPLSAGVIY